MLTRSQLIMGSASKLLRSSHEQAEPSKLRVCSCTEALWLGVELEVKGEAGDIPPCPGALVCESLGNDS